MTDTKPYSQACENNKDVILAELKGALANATKVLEIGSGSGQHAVHFAPALPHLVWHTADQAHYHEGIYAWIQDFPSENLRSPMDIKLPELHWEKLGFDAFYSANTAHIMQKSEVEYMMNCINQELPTNGVFCQYGPFTVEGEFSSQSNHDFHHKLLSEGLGGYRDIDELSTWALDLTLSKIVEMPANNLLLIWQKA